MNKNQIIPGKFYFHIKFHCVGLGTDRGTLVNLSDGKIIELPEVLPENARYGWREALVSEISNSLNKNINFNKFKIPNHRDQIKIWDSQREENDSDAKFARII